MSKKANENTVSIKPSHMPVAHAVSTTKFQRLNVVNLKITKLPQPEKTS